MLNFFKKENSSVSETLKSKAPVVDDKSKERVSSISIFTMPEKFRADWHAVKNSRSTGIWIMALGVILLATLSAGAYYFLIFNKNKPEAIVENNISENNIPEEQVSDEQKAQEIARQAEAEAKEKAKIDAVSAYVSFRRAMASSPTIDEFLVQAQQYGTEKFIAYWQSLLEKTKTLSVDDQDRFIILASNFLPADKDITAEINTSLSTAALSFAVSPNSRASMALDDGVWKVDEEAIVFQNEEGDGAANISEWLDLVNKGEEVSKIKENKDTDADGLTEKEEIALGTSDENKDSDGDSYLDGEEVSHKYDPAGKGKLIDNKGLKVYEDVNFNYSVMYPADWRSSFVGGTNALIFSSPDGEFFQVTVQPNPDKQNLADWYKKQFPDETADAEKYNFADKSLSGLKSQDGHNIYLADESDDYIFAITYSSSDGETFSYPNLFEVFASSFIFTK